MNRGRYSSLSLPQSIDLSVHQKTSQPKTDRTSQIVNGLSTRLLKFSFLSTQVGATMSIKSAAYLSILALINKKLDQ